MVSSWVLVCGAAASVLVLLSSACRDEESCLQREAPLPPELIGQQPLNPFVLQREIDLTDLLNPEDFIEQRVIEPTWPKESSASADKPPPGSRPRFGPRSFPFVVSYPVQFPLSRPSPDNIQAICDHSDHRPRYPVSYFPQSGFGQQRRKGRAVNNAELWFSTCCKGNQTWGTEGTLCCATQAWEHSIKLYCEDDSSVKDRLYVCCWKSDINRLNCFDKESPNPNYEPTEELPVEAVDSTENFLFNRNICPRNLMSPRVNRENKEVSLATSQKIDVVFPPGMPTEDNIESLCRNQRFRPLYSTKCLPRSGYEMLARQVKTINRLEKRFKQCCKKKKGALNCAKQKWREEVNRYCSVGSGDQVDLHCCQEKDQYSCFQSISLDPAYNRTSATEPPSLDKMCETHFVINNRFPVGSQLKELCCPLPEEDRNTCFAQKLEQISKNMCLSSKSVSPALRRCCKTTSREEIPQCFSKNLLEAITKATKKGQKKKKKICPIP